MIYRILGWLMIGCVLILTIAIPMKYPDVAAIRLFELYWVSYLGLAVSLVAGSVLVLLGRR